jgi:hypothetical protein
MVTEIRIVFKVKRKQGERKFAAEMTARERGTDLGK